MPNRATLVPDLPTDVTVYLVLDDFGRHGRAWRETDENQVDEATVIENLLEGQYEKPARIVAFNTAEGWSRDVTEDIARAAVEVARKPADRSPPRRGLSTNGTPATMRRPTSHDDPPRDAKPTWRHRGR